MNIFGKENIFCSKHTKGNIRLIAHRGFTPVAPENTLVSFEEAGKRHFWAIETDIHKTKDGALVCCHNSNTLKMYGEDLVIEDVALKDLEKLRIVKGNCVDSIDKEKLRMPLFSEYIAICKKYGAVPFLESKGDVSVVPDIIDYLKKEDMIQYTVFSSIQLEHILAAADISNNIFLHHIFSSEENLAIFSKRGNCGVSYNYPDLSTVPDGLIKRTHDAGVKLCLRAGDTVEKCETMLSMGLDYIPTNKVTPYDVTCV